MKQEERLTPTDWSINGQAEIYQYLSSIPQYNIRHHQTLCSCVRRTAEYEDTGLSPAEVEELKHRADVAEEALRNGAVGEDLYCSSDDERHRLYLHLIREAEQRLKERNNDRD